MGSGNSTPQRRNTDQDGVQSQLQYRTNRGPIPVNIVPQQVQNAPLPGPHIRRDRYPKEHRNEEGPRGNTHQNFETYTTGPGRAAPGAAGGRLHEYPIPTAGTVRPFDYDQRPARLQQVMYREALHPNERAFVARQPPLNDPGATRAIVRTVDAGDGRPEQKVVVGVVAHPHGNPQGFERAPVEPINRQGRQGAVRHQDMQNGGRQLTYPPRGVDAEWVAGVERRGR
ncbi:hypothetical protein QBC34DRAFT_411221 [Podospora aff. communis PSN243]|uniref:Uncharacterized protein n=1 Tax=Podospora aff. communis PSN243 TaxID=3040156 RepID=A0AAV9GF44_9PEZI|nr:hypothetical protein QBC34DRAFT_411221 [Podospora aff. communis PSN243]